MAKEKITVTMESDEKLASELHSRADYLHDFLTNFLRGLLKGKPPELRITVSVERVSE